MQSAPVSSDTPVKTSRFSSFFNYILCRKKKAAENKIPETPETEVKTKEPVAPDSTTPLADSGTSKNTLPDTKPETKAAKTQSVSSGSEDEFEEEAELSEHTDSSEDELETPPTLEAAKPAVVVAPAPTQAPVQQPAKPAKIPHCELLPPDFKRAKTVAFTEVGKAAATASAAAQSAKARMVQLGESGKRMLSSGQPVEGAERNRAPKMRRV